MSRIPWRIIQMPHCLHSSISHQDMGAKMSEKKEEIQLKSILHDHFFIENHLKRFVQQKAIAHWQSHHVGARASKHHVSGVKLKSADGSLMLAIQDGHLHPTLSAPHVNSSILGACGEKHTVCSAGERGRWQHAESAWLCLPIMTNCESGVKQASRDSPLLLL